MLKSLLTTLNIVPTRIKAVSNIEKYILTLQIIHKQSRNLFSKNSFQWWGQLNNGRFIDMKLTWR